jgi:hypothetical protein
VEWLHQTVRPSLNLKPEDIVASAGNITENQLMIQIFIDSIKRNHINVAEFMYNKVLEIDKLDMIRIFEEVCECSNLNSILWIYNLIESKDQIDKYMMFRLFEKRCSEGDVDVAEFMYVEFIQHMHNLDIFKQRFIDIFNTVMNSSDAVDLNHIQTFKQRKTTNHDHMD